MWRITTPHKKGKCCRVRCAVGNSSATQRCLLPGYFFCAGDISAEPVTGQKIEEYFVGTDLDLHNDESRRNLTSGAAAEERQEVLLYRKTL